MSYKLNKTDGELLVELADGQIDTTTTDVTLIGRNFKGFGEAVNENFIKILENFASTGAPSNPLVGQLWYDTSSQRLRLYDGTSFRTSGGPIVSATRPDMVAGDIWIDNANNKMYFFDGTDLVLVGPDYDSGQGQTGFEVVSVIDISARERVVLKIWIGGTLFGVITKEEFRLSGTNKMPGYPDDPDDVVFPARQLFLKGFNLVDSTFFYQGTAAKSRSLVDVQGNAFTSADFLPTTENGETTGSIIIRNPAGLGIALEEEEYATLKVIGTTTSLETQQKETAITIRTRTSNRFENAFYADGATSRVGIYRDDPEYTLDVDGTFRSTGDAIIDGNLTVNGNTTYINIDNLQIADINIELGVVEGGTPGTDAQIDGAGVIMKSSDGDKSITFDNATQSFDLTETINIPLGKDYRIEDQLVLSRTTLGSTVTTANGLTSIGTLVELDVDNVNIDGSTITVSTPLNINASGDISVTNSKITNLANPTNAQDATTKTYVDTQLRSQNFALSIDITGLTVPSVANPYTDVRDILEDIATAANFEDGVEARIHCTSYSNVNVTGIDVQGAMNKSYISVMADDSSAVSVVEDVNFDPVAGSASFVPDRSNMLFRTSGGTWVWVSTT